MKFFLLRFRAKQPNLLANVLVHEYILKRQTMYQDTREKSRCSKSCTGRTAAGQEFSLDVGRDDGATWENAVRRIIYRHYQPME
jgi:hypothetical protein